MASHGASQDPLNYLIRSTKKATHIPEHIKRHVLSVIKKAKLTTANDIDSRIAQYHAIYCHREMMRLQELIETLEPTSTAYKNAVFSLCKLTENYRRSLAGTRRSKTATARKTELMSPPVSDTQ